MQLIIPIPVLELGIPTIAICVSGFSKQQYCMQHIIPIPVLEKKIPTIPICESGLPSQKFIAVWSLLEPIDTGCSK